MAGRRQRRDQHVGVLEIVCILLVLLAVAALIAWVVTQAGGGHNLT
jgi:hypothetical protein